MNFKLPAVEKVKTNISNKKKILEYENLEESGSKY